ncbi:MAG TPA: Mur ligase domain-containing protein [Candidatus Saccharimonadales bacterium]|nr:Mur ligase domain-containing protein [Candidatus Saccharimonadales bacterium]
MHIFFSGIGGMGLGPLAQIAHQAGYDVSGSDKQSSLYIDYLRKQGITDITTTQDYTTISVCHERHPIDWLVYTSALPMEHADPDELRFAREHGIRFSKRDELLNHIIEEKRLSLIAVAGTHGKTTTTAQAVWLLNRLGIPTSYSVGAKLPFGDMGHFDPTSHYFIYEADEYDRNFLYFHPSYSLISGLDWDHPDIYPTRDSYNEAFRTFIEHSQHVIAWQSDITQLQLPKKTHLTVLDDHEPAIATSRLLGAVNRRNAWLVACGLQTIASKPARELLALLNDFPGVSRRFEQIVPHLYSDYAHTPPKIRGALQLAHEVAGDNVVVVYEGLHNSRQHFIKSELAHLFDAIKQLYIVPSYLAREDPDLSLLSPKHLLTLLSPAAQAHSETAGLDTHLRQTIAKHLAANDLVLCLTAGGGGSLDEWLRQQFGMERSDSADQ